MHGGEADTSDGGAHEYLGYYRWKRRRRKIGIKMEDGRKGEKKESWGAQSTLLRTRAGSIYSVLGGVWKFFSRKEQGSRVTRHRALL